MKLACTLPNASECINGVAFTKQDGMMVSVADVDDIPQDLVDIFLSIDGYALLATADEVDLTDDEKAELEKAGQEQAEPSKQPAKRTSNRKTAKGA